MKKMLLVLCILLFSISEHFAKSIPRSTNEVRDYNQNPNDQTLHKEIKSTRDTISVKISPNEVPPVHSERRIRRYTTTELKWPRTNLTWRLVNVNMGHLDADWVRGVLRSALDVWSRETPLNFKEVNQPPVDIEVGFSRKLQEIFNTTETVLGYANSPNPRKVSLRFDANRNWTISHDDNYSESDLMYTAVHEFGHALGLGHSKVDGAIMHAIYKFEFHKLHDDDRKAIQSLYGPRGKDPSTKSRILRTMKGIRNNLRWNALAVSDPIEKFFKNIF